MDLVTDNAELKTKNQNPKSIIYMMQKPVFVETQTDFHS